MHSDSHGRTTSELRSVNCARPHAAAHAFSVSREKVLLGWLVGRQSTIAHVSILLNDIIHTVSARPSSSLWPTAAVGTPRARLLHLGGRGAWTPSAGRRSREFRARGSCRAILGSSGPGSACCLGSSSGPRSCSRAAGPSSSMQSLLRSYRYDQVA